MNVTRRTLLKNLAAAPAVLAVSRFAQAADAKVIKISHQFPGGSIDKGDFRDRLTRKFAVEVEKRTNGSLRFEIYPGSSLMKTNSQFAALRKGAALIVSEQPPRPGVPWLSVPDAREALATAAALFYGDPAEALTLVGVTGTTCGAGAITRGAAVGVAKTTADGVLTRPFAEAVAAK